MTVEEQIRQLVERVEHLEQDFCQLVGVMEQLYSIMEYISTGRSTEFQQLKDLAAQIMAFATEKKERLTRGK